MRVIKTRSEIAPRLTSIEKQLQDVPRKGYDFFKRITPKDSGNARSRTRLVNTVIEADYPYAVRLDKGWSRQAPNGMSRPTISYMKQLVKKIIGK
jgi:hypothetical protein